jgi:hypothetical protein
MQFKKQRAQKLKVNPLPYGIWMVFQDRGGGGGWRGDTLLQDLTQDFATLALDS